MHSAPPGRTRSSILFASGLSLLISLSVSSASHAWGGVGHRVISRFSAHLLTAKASAGIASILADARVRELEPRPQEERQCRFC
jgi:hypothetical protein